MNVYEGMPPRLYRHPSEIRSDMLAITGRIKETEEMLSVHNLLLEMLPEWASLSPERWIPELTEIVAEAEEALERLSLLRDGLNDLAAELEDVRCMMKR
jgi:hypothetical protein